MVKIRKRGMRLVEQTSFKVTKFIGTPTSIILHTLFFVGVFGFKFLGVATDNILLVLTTAVSLEAIYLSIFIQMSVNKTAESLEAVEDDIEDIAEDVEEIQTAKRRKSSN